MATVPTPHNLHFEHLPQPLGVGSEAPRLSWSTDAAEAEQVAIDINVTDLDAAETQQWRVETQDRTLVPWPATPLSSRSRRAVSVRTITPDGASNWSDDAVIEAGLLSREDWRARMVGAPAGYRGPLPLIRRAFQLDRSIERARLYITAHGVYDVEINGVPASTDLFAPGWQAYEHRLKYQTYDVTDHLAVGANAIGIRLGDGWYRGRLGFLEQRALYGDDLAVRAQLEVIYDDGSSTMVASDDTWEWAPGPILESDLYDGETYDFRAEVSEWSGVAAAGRWQAVELRADDDIPLVAPTGPPVRATAELEPVSIFQSPTGKTLIDFGQNIVGFVRLSVDGPAGSVITLRHAEVLEDGEIGVRPLRTARATDTLILDGLGPRTWQPRFTFHGFRFVEVDGWPGGSISATAVSAIVVHSDMTRTGWFESDHALLNRLHENVVWGMRGNFLDIPTDCPQRDERLGWTGDISVFAPTAAFLYDCSGMLESWLQDLRAEQHPDGLVPYFVPDVPFPANVSHIPGFSHTHAAAWGDAAVTVPWALYEAFGDLELLGDAFESMKRWVDGVTVLAGADRVWDSGFQFGDWLDPTAPPDRPGDAATDKYLVATAYFAQSTRILSRAAEALGRREDSIAYSTLADEISAAFRSRYVKDGRLASDTQTAHALAFSFDLLLPGDRMQAASRLIELVRESGHTITTGFVGTPLILDALVLAGGLEDAYQLLLQTECPSWLYTVKQGGTTIWERWDSMLPDGSINPGEMTSFNHYALGAVASWMHSTVGGLAPASPGWRTLRIAPRPGGGLRSSRVTHDTPFGRATVAWAVDDAGLTVDADVPPGSTATVDIPGMDVVEVGAGHHTWRVLCN